MDINTFNEFARNKYRAKGLLDKFERIGEREVWDLALDAVEQKIYRIKYNQKKAGRVKELEAMVEALMMEKAAAAEAAEQADPEPETETETATESV